MSDTTSIDDLPTASGQNANTQNQNVVIQKTEPGAMSYSPNVPDLAPLQQQQQQQPQGNLNQQHNQGPPLNPSQQPNQKLMNELISGVQRASMTGMTALPSRDIPRDTSGMMQDAQVQPTYVPQPQRHVDYIQDHETSSTLERVMHQNTRGANRADTLETFYEEIQSPLMLAILYFAFQLPAVKRYMFRYLPSALFSADGNANLTGLIATSAMFGLAFYTMQKGMTRLTEF
uniref:Uncharacterized protein n=1 Tax=viral metagenome TaxID=1070528 RepID=A0A6C0LZE2_9ZZZZ